MEDASDEDQLRKAGVPLAAFLLRGAGHDAIHSELVGLHRATPCGVARHVRVDDFVRHLLLALLLLAALALLLLAALRLLAALLLRALLLARPQDEGVLGLGGTHKWRWGKVDFY